MEINLEIRSGERQGISFSLHDTSSLTMNEIPWVLEDETIQFELLAPSKYHSAVLELYQHSIQVTEILIDPNNQDIARFIWRPIYGDNSPTSKLFWLYFGVAELNVLLKDEDGVSIELVEFQPLQVVAKKSSADKVEKMFEYLASISSEALHSVFSATRHSVGFEEGLVSPNYTFERLEHAIDALRELLPLILKSPLTRLVPEHKLVPVTGREELDDSSIGWLVENLSLLQPADCNEDAHIFYDGDHFKASALQLPVLNEITDIYENRVIHGYIEQLIRVAQSLINRMELDVFERGRNNCIPSNYVSFFEKIGRFKTLLLGSQINKINTQISTLKQLKMLLDRHIPAKYPLLVRPIITPRVQGKPAYRDLFVEIIKWHEKGQIDWSAYENLFAIENISMLFETYTYFRVLNACNNILESSSILHDYKPLKTSFIGQNGTEVNILREPEYWVINHNNRNIDNIVNSEGYTVYKDKKTIRSRGQKGINSKRVPDIVIQIRKPNDSIRLLILDAKYSSADKSFIDYLPELTMKYVHGIQRIGQSERLVASMTILYPDERAGFRDFHFGQHSIFGNTPSNPSLAVCGVLLGDNRDNDLLFELLKRLFEIEEVKPILLHLVEPSLAVA